MRSAQRLLFLLLLFILASPALAQDYTGWWWIPSESGSGYSLQVQELPDQDYDLAYLVWYLYDETGASTWASAILRVWGDDMNGDLVQYEGWPLEQGLVAEVTPTRIGHMSLHFKDENTATLFYTVQGLTDTKTIQRWTKFGTDDPRALTGWWWDESKPGMGWFLEAKHRHCYLGWFNYREAPTRTGGEPRWFSALSEPFEFDQTPFSEPLHEYSGGQTFHGEYQEPTATEYNPSENFTFSLPEDDPAQSLDIEYGGQAYHLTRFAIPDISTTPGCTPMPLSLYPGPNAVFSDGPTTSSFFSSPCGSALDKNSVVLTVNGQVETPLVTALGEEGILSVFLDVSSAWSYPESTHIELGIADEYGNELALAWEYTFIGGDY